MVKTFWKFNFFTFILFFSICFAQDPNPLQQFAKTLIAAKTYEERNQLLDQHKELLTVELRKELIAQADTLRIKSNFPEALAAYEVAFQTAEIIDDKSGIAEALINIALINRIQGDMDLALQNIQKSLAVAEDSGDKFLIARSLLYTGIFYRYQGNNAEALSFTNKALELSEHLPEKELAFAWNNIGAIYLLQGNFGMALKNYEKALAIREKLGDKEAIAGSLNNIAVAYDNQGSVAEALDYYKRSLKIREELGDKANIANVMNNMGDVRLLGSYDLALEYNKKSLVLAEEIGDKPLIARAIGNIGNAYVGKGDFDHALEYSFKALAMAEELGDKEVTSNEEKHIADAFFSKGDYEKSMDYAQRAEKLAREIGGRQQLWTALEVQGACYRKLNQPQLARKTYEEAIGTIEDWRSLVAGGELEEQGLFSEKLSVYHGMIELMVEQNQIAEALTYAEKAKARALLDVLHSGKIDIAKQMTPQEQFEEAKWNKDLVALNRGIQSEKNNSEANQARISLLESQLQQVRLNYEAFHTKLYASHPELKIQRGEIATINLKESAELFPDSSTAVLEYVVTETKVILFALVKSGDVDTPAVRAYSIEIKQEDLAKQIRSFREMIANRDVGFRDSAAELFELLLEPAINNLKNCTKLIIVPDDILWELPFQTLQSKQNHFVLEDYALSYVPSLTVLREMRDLRKRENNSKNPKLLALGNPFLGKATIAQAQYSYRNANLAPLPEAEKEVETLAEIYGESQSKIYIRSDAREDYFKSQADKFQILHLATHGILNNVTPMYSYLALTPDESGTEDGLLEARELMNLNLHADLVTLSACETALGKVGQGEGVIGLTWALFIAGVPSTMVSQWKVDSASTTELMLSFHRNLKSGQTKADALRNAALKLAKNNRYSHPFFWAPFVLIGDSFSSLSVH